MKEFGKCEFQWFVGDRADERRTQFFANLLHGRIVLFHFVDKGFACDGGIGVELCAGFEVFEQAIDRRGQSEGLNNAVGS